MVNKILASFIAADLLFVLCGGLLLGVVLVTQGMISAPPTSSTITQVLLLSQCPLIAGIANAILVFVTFLLSIPGMVLPGNRIWLKIHGWMVVVCAWFTLILGLTIWFDTLRTRSNLSTVWAQQTPQVQSLLQQKFDCCGYLNSTAPPFQPDQTCTTPLEAAQKLGCVGPFSTYANNYLDIIFTADFGIVAIDVILLLCVVVVLKDRKERERYRLIDAKNGVGSI